MGNVTCSFINVVCSCAFDYPGRERVCCGLGTAAEFWYVFAMPRTGGANEFVVRRCVDTPDTLLLKSLLRGLFRRRSQRTHEPKKRSVPLSSLRCLLSVVSDCVCTACGVSRHEVQGTRYEEQVQSTHAKCYVQRKDDTQHTDTGHVITRSPDTLARVYRGLTATSLLADTLINDVLMPWHDSFQDVLGQESLFSDADGACGLEALAGRFDWDSLAQILFRAHFPRMSRNPCPRLRDCGVRPGLRCARSHTLTAHTTWCALRGTQYVHGTWYNAHCTTFRVNVLEFKRLVAPLRVHFLS